MQPLADRRVGHEHDVVLILADHVRPLSLQDADDAERDVADADRLAERIAWSETASATSVWPITQTLSAELTSRSVKKPPCRSPSCGP